MTSILIHTPANGLIYGAYHDGSIWCQSDDLNPPTHLFQTVDRPTFAGEWGGSVYGSGDEFEADGTAGFFDVFFRPDDVGTFTASIFVDSNGDDMPGEFAGEGYSRESVAATDVDRVVDVALSANDIGIDVDFDNIRGDIKKATDFNTLVITLLFTDGRASKYQAMDRRGWLGDPAGDTFSSLLWLKFQSKVSEVDLREMERYAAKALNYMVRNNICDRIQVAASRDGLRQVRLSIKIFIGGDAIKIYVPVWQQVDAGRRDENN